ncbi:OLC1v1028190C1 [Oldenlandia corymbosa var. corymbosa]|uniref:OLC1v1028190C1 n=1 Tax=Oldenlandia corymbosa var. corymbosa TaxID=529605 RepID=A0AAV1CDZ1_OLDCO|nr:OLC1v1028190C1 [Oldenlandia corymbosa var. corymbosa]
MSLSYSDCFSDLLCSEDSGTVLSGEDHPECSSEIDSRLPPPEDLEESIEIFIKHERNYVPGKDYAERFQSQSIDASARAESIAWILKVQRYYGFQPLTAYLSVNYFDRVLYSRSLPKTSGWPMQLLSVACLSLAAKMEEPLVPSLLDLQIEGAKYVFEPRTISRMELLVLSTLDWRLRSITPFSFIGFFAQKVDPTGTYSSFLISRASQIILSHIQDASFLGYWPSCIAAATILCAARDLPLFSFLNPEYAESWCDGLQRVRINFLNYKLHYSYLNGIANVTLLVNFILT